MEKYMHCISVILCVTGLLMTGCSSQMTMEYEMGETGTEEFHREVGKGLEALYATELEEHLEYLAYHYARSDDKEKAIHYLMKAGDRAKEVYANKQAAEYYSQALGLMDAVQGIDPSMRGYIYQSLGEIYFRLAKHEEALESCRKALEYTSDRKGRARVHGLMGWTYERDLILGPALEHVNAGIAELGDGTEQAEMARIYIPLAWINIWEGDGEKAMEIALRGIEIGERTENYFAVAQLYICLIWIHMAPSYRTNDLDKGFEYAQKSVEAAKRSGDPFSMGHSIYWLGWAHMRKGEDEDAIKLMKEAIEIYKKTEHNYHISKAHKWLSQIYLRKGDLQGFMDMTKWVIEL